MAAFPTCVLLMLSSSSSFPLYPLANYVHAPPLQSRNMTGHPKEVSPLALSIYGGALFLVVFAYMIIRSCLEKHLPTLPRFRQQMEASQDGVESGNSSLEMIPAYRYSKRVLPVAGGENSCAVCLCEFKEEEEVRDLPHCRHSFHVPCIDMWLQTHSTCPICRTTSLVQISCPPDSGAAPEREGHPRHETGR